MCKGGVLRLRLLTSQPYQRIRNFPHLTNDKIHACPSFSPFPSNHGAHTKPLSPRPETEPDSSNGPESSKGGSPMPLLPPSHTFSLKSFPPFKQRLTPHIRYA